VCVIRLPVDVGDPVHRRAVERMYSTGFSMYRTAQRRVRSRLRAYWATRGERTRDPARLRERLRLSKKSLEYAAYADLNAAPHLRRHITKALAMNLADSVWAAAERHLFPDATGKRFGMPGVGRWYDFRRLPGRAQSHTEEHKWESFRLHGTLAGHRAAYRSTSGRFFQPRRMRPVAEPKSWWRYEGPLALVFSGLPDGTLILPIRLPSAPSNQAILDHHLGDPSKWHKIDLVRTRDPSVLGGWRYEAHLMVLAAPYASPATRAAREAAAIAGTGRCGGIDVNVSNVTIASHENEDDLRVTRVVRGAKARTRAHRRARQERRRLRALDRSRRAANAAQYELSKRQAKRARRREAAGLRPVQVIPAGPRKAGSDGKPLQAYWRDTLTQGYRRKRAERAAAAASAARARKADARTTAKRVVAEHGFRFVVEDVSPRTWFKRWGRALAAATPGMLVSAIEHEANVVAAIANQRGGLARASTRTTALSQHCLCGQRVAKELGQRRHTCVTCGLQGDRDTIAAVLAAHVVFGTRNEPASARVDYVATRTLLARLPSKEIDYRILLNRDIGRQDAQSESSATTARDGFFVTETECSPDLVVVARRIVGGPPLQSQMSLAPRQTTLDRIGMRTNLSFGATASTWDSS